jgi:hypothetical protein
MKVKEGVKLTDLQFAMRDALIAADKIYEENGHELTVTSTGESVHSAGSYHYYGLAFDIRTRDLDDIVKQKIYKKLSEDLEGRFRVILEKTHIHIQFIIPKGNPS